MVFETYIKSFREAAINAGYSELSIQRCLNYAEPLISKGFPVIYNTSHLASLVGYKKKYLKRAALYPIYFYREFKIPKKDGIGTRTIKEPLPSLKEIQKWILDNLLYEVEVSKYVKSYVPKRNIRDNVKYHKNQKVVVTLDIEDFFPSINIKSIERIFKQIGYSSLISNLLSKLCCLDDSLPQGSPTSPYLSNIVLLEFDKSMEDFCLENSIRYTRYADDLTFSGNFDPSIIINKVRATLYPYGLKLKERKTRIMKSSQRQHVTGIVVNKKLQIPRETRKEIRQSYYYIKKYGLDNHIKHIKFSHANYLKHIIGKVEYILFINPADVEAIKIRDYLKSLQDIGTQ